MNEQIIVDGDILIRVSKDESTGEYFADTYSIVKNEVFNNYEELSQIYEDELDISKFI